MTNIQDDPDYYVGSNLKSGNQVYRIIDQTNTTITIEPTLWQRICNWIKRRLAK